jgi:hypothetical protein
MTANPLPLWKQITQTLWFLLLLPFLLLFTFGDDEPQRSHDRDSVRR